MKIVFPDVREGSSEAAFILAALEKTRAALQQLGGGSGGLAVASPHHDVAKGLELLEKAASIMGVSLQKSVGKDMKLNLANMVDSSAYLIATAMVGMGNSSGKKPTFDVMVNITETLMERVVGLVSMLQEGLDAGRETSKILDS